jgi:hypothetical protein
MDIYKKIVNNSFNDYKLKKNDICDKINFENLFLKGAKDGQTY